MALKQTVLFTLLFVQFSVHFAPEAFSSNGSSGVGNASVQIAEDVFAVIPQGWASRKNNLIIDAKSGKNLLEIRSINETEVRKLISSGKLVEAKLGSVKAFEYLPPRGSASQNYWIICSKKIINCSKVEMKSKTNPKAPALMGSLKKMILKKDIKKGH